MQWALLAVVVIALFLMAGRYPRLAFSILGCLVVAVVAAILLTENDTKIAGKKISPADVAVENSAAIPAYGGSYRLTGRLLNNSDSIELKEVVLSIVMEDCVQSECQIVGQTTQRINLQVPAGQARDFSVNAYLGEPEIAGTIRWSFDITDTRS